MVGRKINKTYRCERFLELLKKIENSINPIMVLYKEFTHALGAETIELFP